MVQEKILSEIKVNQPLLIVDTHGNKITINVGEIYIPFLKEIKDKIGYPVKDL